MRRAVAISAEALTSPGTEPFGAVVVKDGRIHVRTVVMEGGC